MNNQQDINTSLDRVIKDRFINYMGCAVEVIIGGLRWDNKTFKNYAELEEHIKTVYKAIGDSIKKGQS